MNWNSEKRKGSDWLSHLVIQSFSHSDFESGYLWCFPQRWQSQCQIRNHQTTGFDIWFRTNLSFSLPHNEFIFIYYICVCVNSNVNNESNTNENGTNQNTTTCNGTNQCGTNEIAINKHWAIQPGINTIQCWTARNGIQWNRIEICQWWDGTLYPISSCLHPFMFRTISSDSYIQN